MMNKRLHATVAKAVADLRTTVKAELCLEFAELKTTVVASRDRLATRVAGTVGSEKAKAKGKKYQAQQLGIDQTAGKRYKAASKQETTTQQERIVKCKKESKKHEGF